MTPSEEGKEKLKTFKNIKTKKNIYSIQYEAQSGCSYPNYDKIIRAAKISELITNNMKPVGLGKNKVHCRNDNGYKGKSNLKKPTSSPQTSHRVASRDSFKETRSLRDALKYEDFCPQMGGDTLTLDNFISQGLLPTIELTTDVRTSNLMSSITDQISKINESGVTVNIDFITTIKKHFAALLEKAKDQGVPLVLGLSIAFCATKAHYTKSSIWVALTTILSMITALYELATPLKKLIAYLTKIAVAPIGAVDLMPPPEGQGFEPQSFKNCISGTILSYVYTSMFVGLKGPNHVNDYLKKISDVPKWGNGISYMVDFMTNLIQGFLDYLTKWFGCKNFVIAQYPYPESVEYSKEVDALLNEFAGGLPINYENGQKFYALEAKYGTLLTKIPTNTSDGRDARHLLLMAKAALKPLGARFARANIVNNGPRIPPLGVMISGPSGMGKTAIMTFIMNAVSAAVLPDHDIPAFEKNHNDTTFVRNPASAFWDGYHSQFNTYVDDVGQTVDVPGADTNAYMELISMLGPGNYPVPMAHLEDKGNVNFNSPMVYSSTNRTLFHLNSLYYNEAFCRRWEVCYLMVVKEEYCKPGFEKNNPRSRRVDHWPTTPRNDFHYLEFFPWNCQTGAVGTTSISYDDLIALIISRYNAKYRSGVEMIKMHQMDKEIQLLRRKDICDALVYSAEVYDQAHSVLVKHSEPICEKDNVIKCHAQMADGIPGHYSPNNYSRTLRDPPPLSIDTSSTFIVAQGQENIGANDLKLHLLEPGFDEDFIATMPTVISGPDRTSWLVNVLTAGDLCDLIREEVKVPYKYICTHFRTLMEKDFTFYELSYKIQIEYQNSKSYCKRFVKWSKDTVLKWDTYKALATKWMAVIASAASLVSAWALASRAMEYFFPAPMVAQSPTGMKHSRVYVKPSVHEKNGVKFRKVDLKNKNSGRGHMQLRGVTHEEQAATDNASVDQLRSIVRRTQYCIQIPGSAQPMGKLNFVVPYVALMPAHFGERISYGYQIGEFDDDSCIEIWSVMTPEVKIKIPIQQVEIILSESGNDNDWCLMRIPPVIGKTPNMLKFWSDDTTKYDTGSFTVIINLVRETEAFLLQTQCNSLNKKVAYCDYEIAGGWQYDVATVAGDCGGLISVVNTGVPTAKLIGIHTAFGGGKGFAPKITRKGIEEALAFFEDHVAVPLVADDIDDIYNPNIPSDIIEGFAPQAYGRRVPTAIKSNIIASPLQNTYHPTDMAPAILKPQRNKLGVFVDPMVAARNKYSNSSVCLSPFLLRIVTQDVLRRFMHKSINSAPWLTPKVFTFEEAVAGVPGLQFCDGIPRGTSAGYPYKLDIPKGHAGKTHFFGRTDDYEFTSAHCLALKERVADVVEKASRGHRSLHVFVDFLKDERKQKIKVAELKARMVSASPIDLLIAHRMYFLDFVRWFMENRIKNGSAVGVNHYSSEWSLIFKTLTSVAPDGQPCIIAGDYKGFDGSITTQLENEVLYIVNQWYHDGNDKIREVLWLEACQSRHITGDLIYEWDGSNPSGFFGTTFLNTTVNLIIIEYAFVDALSKGAFRKMEVSDFNRSLRAVDSFGVTQEVVTEDSGLHVIKKELITSVDDSMSNVEFYHIFSMYALNVRAICFGDDNIIGVSPLLGDQFNQQIMTNTLKTMGFTYTTEAKDGKDVEPLRPIFDVSFLKRSFIKSVITKTIICPLEMAVILEIPQWTIAKDSDWLFTKINVDIALRELSLHPPDVYDLWAPKIINASRTYLQYEPEVIDYTRLQLTTLSRKELL
jgi:hypothetical protein